MGFCDCKTSLVVVIRNLLSPPFVHGGSKVTINVCAGLYTVFGQAGIVLLAFMSKGMYLTWCFN
jgi:hypothetical protein